MRYQTLGDKRGFIADHVRNAEASTTIPKGTPCILAMNGTEDGFAVVLPSSSSAAKIQAFYWGVATDDILAGAIGEVQRSGFCRYAKVRVRTRANTSGGSSWSTVDTQVLGALLTIDSVNNCFVTAADTVAAASSDNQTLSNVLLNAGRLGESLNSVAGVATSTADSLTVSTVAAKAFLRMM